MSTSILPLHMQPTLVQYLVVGYHIRGRIFTSGWRTFLLRQRKQARMFLSDRLLSLTARVFVHANIYITFVFVAYSSVASCSGIPYNWLQGIIYLYIHLRLNTFLLCQRKQARQFLPDRLLSLTARVFVHVYVFYASICSLLQCSIVQWDTIYVAAYSLQAGELFLFVRGYWLECFSLTGITFVYVAYSSVVSCSGVPYRWSNIHFRLENFFASSEKIGQSVSL